MRFVSTRVRETKAGFDLTGDLTIRGVTKSVTFTATGLDRSIQDPWGNRRIGASATTVVDRQDFGISWSDTLDKGGLMLGNEVTLRLELEFVKAR